MLHAAGPQHMQMKPISSTRVVVQGRDNLRYSCKCSFLEVRLLRLCAYNLCSQQTLYGSLPGQGYARLAQQNRMIAVYQPPRKENDGCVGRGGGGGGPQVLPKRYSD